MYGIKDVVFRNDALMGRYLVGFVWCNTKYEDDSGIINFIFVNDEVVEVAGLIPDAKYLLDQGENMHHFKYAKSGSFKMKIRQLTNNTIEKIRKAYLDLPQFQLLSQSDLNKDVDVEDVVAKTIDGRNICMNEKGLKYDDGKVRLDLVPAYVFTNCFIYCSDTWSRSNNVVIRDDIVSELFLKFKNINTQGVRYSIVSIREAFQLVMTLAYGCSEIYADNNKVIRDAHSICADVINAIGNVMTFGANKYTPNSWQQVENGLDRYLAAALRHFTAYMSDNNSCDDESGFSHLDHMLTNLSFIEYLINKEDEKDGKTACCSI